MGTPEVRCVQNPKEFKVPIMPYTSFLVVVVVFHWTSDTHTSRLLDPVALQVEARGRIEKSAEVTFSIFLASGPKPKRTEDPLADGNHPTPNGASLAHGAPPSFPVFDNLLDDAEVRPRTRHRHNHAVPRGSFAFVGSRSLLRRACF